MCLAVHVGDEFLDFRCGPLAVGVWSADVDAK